MVLFNIPQEESRTNVLWYHNTTSTVNENTGLSNNRMDHLRVKKHWVKFLDYSWIYPLNIATILKEKKSIYFVEYSAELWSYPFNITNILKETRNLFLLYNMFQGSGWVSCKANWILTELACCRVFCRTKDTVVLMASQDKNIKRSLCGSKWELPTFFFF